MKRKRAPKQEVLVRRIAISSWDADVSLDDDGRRRKPERGLRHASRLELHGTMDAAVRGVLESDIVVKPVDGPATGASRPIATAAVVEVRPRLHVYVTVPKQNLIGSGSLAVQDGVKYVRLVLAQPRYNYAPVFEVFFGSSPLEELLEDGSSWRS